jgi:hypothetical protein
MRWPAAGRRTLPGRCLPADAVAAPALSTELLALRATPVHGDHGHSLLQPDARTQRRFDEDTSIGREFFMH